MHALLVMFWGIQEAFAKAQEDAADLKPIPLPYDMELVQLTIKEKKFIKIMQGKEPSQVRREGWRPSATASVHHTGLEYCGDDVPGFFGGGGGGGFFFVGGVYL